MIAGVSVFSQVQVDKFTGDASYGLPLITVPNFRGPSVTTSISYRSDIKVDQPASEVGLGWNINAGGSIERTVKGFPDDWLDVNVPNLQTGAFENHTGALHLDETYTNSLILDFDYTRYKMDSLNDSLKYYYPNYDDYYVVGAGMTGKIIPENYDYPAVTIEQTKLKRWFYNQWYYIPPTPGSLAELRKDSALLEVGEVETYSFSTLASTFQYKTNFKYENDFYDEVNSAYFPWNESPLNDNSYLPLNNELSLSTFSGTGYNDENYPILQNQNRTRTSRYVEFYTNEEIAAGGTGFIMEYDSTFNRSVEAEFPQDGIGAYRITNANGYTFHYSLPVYAHYDGSGSFSLDKDYNVVIAEGGEIVATDLPSGYIVENDETHEILEVKQIKKYAVRWLLTAVTGPDYKDSNADGMVDIDDEGYWVKYDYGLWNNTFIDRFPYYGSDYSFSSSTENNLSSKFLDENDNSKVTGKILVNSETASQTYYLNQIQTPSHTGIFVRDYRNDEQSAITQKTIEIEKTEYTSNVDLRSVAKITDHSGTGQLQSDHPSGVNFDHTLLLEPTDYNIVYDEIDLNFNLYGTLLNMNYHIRIYDGNSANGTLLLEKKTGDPIPFLGEDITALSGAIFIDVINVTPIQNPNNPSVYEGVNYRITWDVSDNIQAANSKREPQLKLSQMLLFDNNDLSNLPVLSPIDTIVNDSKWNYHLLNRDAVYNGDWYAANETVINDLALQSIALEQDYSLAKRYNNNKYVNIDVDKKSATQIEVEAAKTVNAGDLENSGKLTLNKVIYYGTNREQTQPSHLFDYGANDPLSNPDYNTLLQDYWGNYKSDGENNLLRGYPTVASLNSIGAWGLRLITSPLGGLTEIVYEADEYEQVLSEDKDGGIRGPIKTFALKNAVVDGNIGGDWMFDLENQESEFLYLQNNLPTGTNTYTVVPGIWINPSDSSSYGFYCPNFYAIEEHNIEGPAVSYGNGTLTSSPNRISGLNYHEINFTGRTPGSFTTSICGATTLVYAGGGFVSFEYPVGHKVKGGGTRVKELRISDGQSIYTVKYAYDQGTATSELSDFSKRKTKKDYRADNGFYNGNPLTSYNFPLTSYDYNPFGMNPQVGYGKVTIENVGETTAGEGKSTFSFHVSDKDKNYSEPYITIYDTTWVIPGGPVGTTINEKRLGIEIIDDFTTIWGKAKEEVLEDVNGLMVSKKVYEYQPSIKGAEVSTTNFNFNFDFTNNGNQNIEGTGQLIGIKRMLPNYLKKVITYSNGRKSESEILERDPISGNPILTKSTAINGAETRDETILAYTQTTPNYAMFGAKSVDPSYNNFLNSTYASKVYRTAEGVVTDDFSSYKKEFWKNTAKTRGYNGGSYTNYIKNVSWFDYTKYVWTGELGNYGLYDNSVFTDISAPPTGASDWRFISEITLMDENQNVLEQRGFNDRFSASKLGYDNRFTYTSASNANYVSFTATGFETKTQLGTNRSYYEGEVLSQLDVQIGSDVNGTDTIKPHTGNYMAKMTSNVGPIYAVKYDVSEGIYSLQRGRTYTASVWVHRLSYSGARLVAELTGNTNNTVTMTKTQSAIQIGDWIQLNVDIEVPLNYAPINPVDGLKIYVDNPTGFGAVWIDDLQFKSRVSGGGMNVYDQRTGRVLATLSDNNFATQYVYNDAGQVIEVWKEVLDEGLIKVESRNFNFKRDME